MVDRIDTQVAFWLLSFVVPAATAALSRVSSCAASSQVTSADAPRGLHLRVDLHSEMGAHRHPRLCAPKRSRATNKVRAEEDDRHGQAVGLAHAHVRDDPPDHGQRETRSCERGEKRRDAQCAR